MENIYELTTWKHPDHYGGFSPDGDFLIYSKNRDSFLLEESNFECIERDITNAANKLPEPENDGEHNQGASWVYTFRANHWGCGWVEYLLVRRDAPEQLQKLCYEIEGALADYPVYDDQDFSEREHEATQEYWSSLSVRERIEYCKENDVSIFQARYDYIKSEGIYQDISGSI